MKIVFAILIITGLAGDSLFQNRCLTIDLQSKASGEATNLSQFAADLEYIQLESHADCLVDKIYSLKVRGNYFYIQNTGTRDSWGQIFCFDNKGKFISKLDKMGRGPGEYELINDYDISSDNTIIAVNSGSEIIFYRRAEKEYIFIRKIALSNSPDKISFINASSDILLQYANTDGTKPFSLELINSEGKSLRSWTNHLKFTLKDGWVSRSKYECLNYFLNGSFFVKELQNDTIFTLKSNLVPEPYLVLNSGDKKLTPGARSNGQYYLSHGFEYLLIQNIMESDKYFYCKYSFNREVISFIYDKAKKIKYSIQPGGFLTDDIAGGVSFRPEYCSNGKFIMWIDAIKFKDYVSGNEFIDEPYKNVEKRKKISELSKIVNENDNPILVIATIK